jgi:hypothetical protein
MDSFVVVMPENPLMSEVIMMALVRWQPFEEIETLQRQMNELFDRLMPSSPINALITPFTLPAELQGATEFLQDQWQSLQQSIAGPLIELNEHWKVLGSKLLISPKFMAVEKSNVDAWRYSMEKSWKPLQGFGWQLPSRNWLIRQLEAIQDTIIISLCMALFCVMLLRLGQLFLSLLHPLQFQAVTSDILFLLILA